MSEVNSNQEGGLRDGGIRQVLLQEDGAIGKYGKNAGHFQVSHNAMLPYTTSTGDSGVFCKWQATYSPAPQSQLDAVT